jgi:hypothetical protein
MPIPDLVNRLWTASEHDEGLPPAEAQALFVEAAEMIEMLRSLLDPVGESGLEDMQPQGRA